MDRDICSITVVITCYNRAHCIVDAIESTFNELPKAEIIVVDDASIDNSVAIINERYADQLKKGSMKLIEIKDNLGVTGAKNTGYYHAKGEWVLFLDSDDYLLENYY